MALYKDGKVYRTLEQQVGHLTEAHKEQLEINLSVESDINNLGDALDGKQDKLTFDTIPVDGSTNPVESNGIYDALAGKQNILTFDNVPTEYSNNPVKSAGIYNALADKQNTLTAGSNIDITSNTIKVSSGSNASGKVLTSNGSGGATWETPASPSIEGTAIKSTGVTTEKALFSDALGGASWDTINAGYIDSEDATSGQVLTADGTGGASWTTPSSGSLEEITLTGSSGTLTAEQLTKVTNNKVCFVSGSAYYYFIGYWFNNYHYRNFDSDTTNLYINRIDVNSNGVWTKASAYASKEILNGKCTGTPKDNVFFAADNNGNITYGKVGTSNLTSGSASSGQVLTANGSGGASWQTPSGGTAKYHHRINGYVMLSIEGDDVPFAVSIDFYNNVSTAYTSIADVISALITAGYTWDALTEKPIKICNGYLWNKGSSFSNLTSFVNLSALNYGGTNYLIAYDVHETSNDVGLFTAGTQTADNFLTDDVIALVG